jgi:hypothetical protein
MPKTKYSIIDLAEKLYYTCGWQFWLSYVLTYFVFLEEMYPYQGNRACNIFMCVVFGGFQHFLLIYFNITVSLFMLYTGCKRSRRIFYQHVYELRPSKVVWHDTYMILIELCFFLRQTFALENTMTFASLEMCSKPNRWLFKRGDMEVRYVKLISGLKEMKRDHWNLPCTTNT